MVFWSAGPMTLKAVTKSSLVGSSSSAKAARRLRHGCLDTTTVEPSVLRQALSSRGTWNCEMWMKMSAFTAEGSKEPPLETVDSWEAYVVQGEDHEYPSGSPA